MFFSCRELINHFCGLNLHCNHRWYLKWTSTDTLAAWCVHRKLVAVVLRVNAHVTGTRSLSKLGLSVNCAKNVKQMKKWIEKMNCQETNRLPLISGLTVPLCGLCGTAPWLKASHPGVLNAGKFEPWAKQPASHAVEIGISQDSDTAMDSHSILQCDQEQKIQVKWDLEKFGKTRRRKKALVHECK
jgi:hypothetical protein